MVLHTLLIFVLDGGEWSAIPLGRSWNLLDARLYGHHCHSVLQVKRKLPRIKPWPYNPLMKLSWPIYKVLMSYKQD